ncbi:hypothetical protein CHS0354_041358 [Potamilus streckersoni]|uniref:Uncharacterized protein n=1 Tax=Potamilus streckersoni TaxID=2493646 RepID=A0AAE0WAH2_9BIVA|nr:hypothetical protein CHS0354_041358 [Potamilus streckersoni]
MFWPPHQKPKYKEGARIDFGFAPIVLPLFMVETMVLTHLAVAKPIVSYKICTKVLFTGDKEMAPHYHRKIYNRSCKRLQAMIHRIATDEGELDFLVSACNRVLRLSDNPQDSEWCFAYEVTIFSSHGVTIENTHKLFLVDD